MFAELYMNHGKKEEARQLYEKVMEIDPGNPVIHLALANYYQESGDAEKSFMYLKMAFQNPEVSVDDKIKILLSYYDISLKNTTRKKEAFELIDLLIAAHPGEPKAYSIQGDFLLREGKFNESKEAFEKVLQYDNSKYPVWEQLMVLYVQLGQWQSLADKSKDAIETFPTQPTLYFYNGYANYMLKEYAKAEESFVAGKDLVVDNENLLLQFYTSLGDTYYKLKKYSESDAAFDKALSIAPNNTIALNNYAYYLSERNTNLEKARDLISRANRLEPKSATFLDTYAWVLFKMGDLVQAREMVEQAIRSGGANNGEILEHYGDILYKSGETEKALEQWQKAKTMGGGLSDQIDVKIRDKKLFE
jgi:tetratricopeptide (TPR) repeat protein